MPSIKNEEIPAVAGYNGTTASDAPNYKAAFFKEFFSTLYLSTDSSFYDLIDVLVHPDLILKIFTTQDKVEDILFNSTSTKQPVSMTSPICAKMLFNLSFCLNEVPLCQYNTSS